MARQPFLPKHKGKHWRIYPDALKDRPELLQIVGRCLTLWPYVEFLEAMLLSLLLKADTEGGAAVFLAIRRGNVQRNVLKAAAEATLTGDSLEVMQALFAAIQSVETERNDLAHCLWGISDQVPDAVLWVDPKNHAQYGATFLRKGGSDFTVEERHTFSGFISVYKKPDLEAVLNAVEKLHTDILGAISLLKNAGTPKGDAAYHRLCSSPRIRQALDQARQGRDESKP